MAELQYPCHKHEITDKLYLAMYPLKELIESIVVRIELGVVMGSERAVD